MRFWHVRQATVGRARFSTEVRVRGEFTGNVCRGGADNTTEQTEAPAIDLNTSGFKGFQRRDIARVVKAVQVEAGQFTLGRIHRELQWGK